ncbi:MAG: TetR/AcrR family transcriptional regulator [Lachnospiraceae bacterium]|nr:TetR/AcrR family transcriptional regulator [Lachnospiraceae bacterium]
MDDKKIIKQRRTDKEIIQNRAVKTREKILVAALDLYMEKGYHKTTVDEIASHANVSTGIAYRYFKNKKDLLLAALIFSFTSIGDIAGVSEADFTELKIEDILTAFERIHTEYYSFHEELEGLRHSDTDVKKLYDDFEETALKRLYDNFPDTVKTRPHSWEDLKIAIGLMENYCHTYMNKGLSENELSYMKSKTIKIIKEELLYDI